MRSRNKPPKSGLGKLLRQYREARSWTQAVVGEDAGIGQGALARIELGECMPRTDTLARIIIALQLSQAELGVLMTEIFSTFQPIDWPARLQIDVFVVCQKRSQQCLDTGRVRDAYGYIQAMLQLAETPEQHFFAHMLQGVQYKAQALFGLAERAFMDALEHARLTKGASRRQIGVWLNLVDLHIDAGHPAAAEVYLEMVERRSPVEEEMFFFKLHSARLGLLGGLPNARETALLLLAEARDLYRGLEEAKPNGSTNADWADALRAEVLGTDEDPARRAQGVTLIDTIHRRNGPARRPVDPELFILSGVILSNLTRDSELADEIQRLARELGYLGVLSFPRLSSS